eukprot:TRINITY_DN12033_c0_g1_i10.p2 TRINITY_DN12033_c0_g1~~TRINITY_DN12033_c0_g1_i10.p2  ORF type:complete len:493 (+),score=90.42 TRINITY_DN12033_c0_g1_i10:1-1479(+)
MKMADRVQLVVDIATAESSDELDAILAHFTDDEQQLLLTELMFKRGTLLMSLIHNRKPIEVIEHAISRGAAINATDPDTQLSALTLACKLNSADIVELLMRNSASLDLLQKNSAVLSVYAHGKSIRMAQILLKHTTSSCSEWPDLPLLLRHALKHPDPLWLELLLQHGLNANHHIVPTTQHGYNQLEGSLLQIALKQQAAAKVDLLLRNGADISEEDLTHYLLEACESADIVMLRALLTKVDDINAVTDSKSTPIHAVCHRGKEHSTAPEALALLIAQGADVNLISPGSRTTPLFEAADGPVQLAEMLIMAGADANVPTGRGAMPLHRASHRGLMDMMQCLLEAGARVNAVNKEGETALYLAACRSTACVRLLLDHAADVNIPNHLGNTPIFNAVKKVDLDMARLLMAKGASLATRNKAGVTPAQAIMTPSALRKPDFEQLLLLCIEAGVCDQPAKVARADTTNRSTKQSCTFPITLLLSFSTLLHHQNGLP